MTTKPLALDPGEELLWSGKPNPNRFAFKRAFLPLLIGLIFILIGIPMVMMPGPSPVPAHWPASFHQMSMAIYFGMWTIGAAFSVVALCGLLSPLWFRLRAIHTTYALTNRRVVIDTAPPRPRTMSIPLEHVRFIEVRAGAGTSGDVIFLETIRNGVDGWGPRSEGFIAIPDVVRVERVLKDAIENTFATRTPKSTP